MLLLVLTGLPGWPTTAAAERMSKEFWSEVQAEIPGTPITVLLYQDQGPRGNRKIKGYFRSATEDSLTLKLEHGPLRTFQKAAIRQVLVGSKRLWSRVQAVKPGTRTKVVLYKDQAPTSELRRIKGRFLSATKDSLTLTLKDGQRRTFHKWAVRKVLTRRPIWKRWPGWVAITIPLALSEAHGRAEGVSALNRLRGHAILGLLIAVVAFRASRMGEIYNVPRKHRMQPPADKPSGAKSKAPGKQGDSQ